MVTEVPLLVALKPPTADSGPDNELVHIITLVLLEIRP